MLNTLSMFSACQGGTLHVWSQYEGWPRQASVLACEICGSAACSSAQALGSGRLNCEGILPFWFAGAVGKGV